MQSLLATAEPPGSLRGRVLCLHWHKTLLVQPPGISMQPRISRSQVPAGSLPRTIEVILRNDQVETVRPGDKAVFTGMLVVVPDVAALT